MAPKSSPDKKLSADDHGDDMQRRVRYQHTMAAIKAIDLLEEGTELKDLYCEQHDDILVKRADGRFVALQVKTRAAHLGPFPATDKDILGALDRFASFQVEFGDAMEHFCILTNASFRRGKKDKLNLPQVIAEARVASTSNGVLSEALQWHVDRMCKVPKVTPELALRVLGRIELAGEQPGLDDAEARLIERLGTLPDLKTRNYTDIQGLARALIQEVERASSLANHTSVRDYYCILTDPDQARADSIIEGKHIAAELVRDVIRKALPAETTLVAAGHIPIEKLPKSMRRLQRKMTAGGVSAENVEISVSLKLSAEHLLAQWLAKHGSAEANKRSEQLETAVRLECQEAFDGLRKPEPFGTPMLREVRRRITERHEKEKESLFFGCQREHLLGVAGILTEECKVWWSEPFDVDGGGEL